MKPFFNAILVFILIATSSLASADEFEKGKRLYESGQYHEAMVSLMNNDTAKNPKAMALIGYMFNNGLGVRKNSEEAFKWYRAAAEDNLSVAQFNLGLMYEQGSGTSANIVEAVKWFRKAAEQNYHPAEMKMGYLTFIKKDYKQAMQWYRRAAKHGAKGAYVDIGVMYAKGFGVKKDLNQAVQYYILGTEKGDADAQALLGTSYAYGKGVQQDTDKAMYWYKQAAKNGSIEAMKELGYIYETGRLGVKKDMQEAERWNEMARKAEQKQ